MADRYVDFGGILQAYANTLTSGFVFNDFEEWYGIAEATTGSEARPQQHGQFASSQSTIAKTNLTLSGFYEGSSYEDAVAAKRLLTRVYNGGAPLYVTFYDNVFPTWREVFIVKVTPVHSAGRSYFSWTVDMETGESPFRYGTVPDIDTTGLRVDGVGVVDPITDPLVQGSPGVDGRVTTTNGGDLPAYSQFTVSGGLSGGFQIVRVKTGQTIELSREVPPGSVVTVNPETGRITLDGDDNDISGQLTRSEWWTVDPDTSEEVQFVGIGTVTGGTPTLTATTYATL